MMQVIIDRFEGDFAVVELPNKDMIDVPKVLFPDAKQGDVIDILINHKETDKRKKRINDLFNKLKKS
ncbi:MAG: DUF3006 domain-containing protein [Methanobrevibacter sp.]|nr:DUF3006 domain-containing protein [Methanobrevibacter sp.]